jgi:hypothetical protein
MAPGPTSGDEYTMTLLALLPAGPSRRREERRGDRLRLGHVHVDAASPRPRSSAVDTIEIEPAIIEGARRFRPAVDAAFDDPRSRIVIDDAKSFFARGKNRYDIIVSEPSNPWVSGVASLFTEEFYARLATYLNDGGVLSQWLHTYEMDATTLASIVAAVSKTFPQFVIYSSIDSDIILIARKGGAPGTFDERALAFPRLQPTLDRLRITDVELIRRRAMISGDVASPFLRTFNAASNSDYFPVVEQRASRTRFTQERVNELNELQASSIPLLEMFGAAPVPSAKRIAATPRTFLDRATSEAWILRDAMLGQRAALQGDSREIAALAVAQWASSCPRAWRFEELLASFAELAEAVNPRLPPDVAGDLWHGLAASACARALDPAQRRWLDLYEAVARRDAARMAATGLAILPDIPAPRGVVSELPFFATVAGFICTAQADKARSLLDNNTPRFVKLGTHTSELRLLAAMSAGPAPRCRGAGS